MDALKESDYPDRSVLLYHLERATLLRQAGQYAKSNREFETAKRIMDRLYTKSVTKAIGTVIVNDAVTDYAGETFERFHVHINQALNYLALGELDNAAVMARQLDEQLSMLEDEREDDAGPRSYTCDPYANYLSGIIFESLQDWGAARVVYERAYQCYTETGVSQGTVPQGLILALLRVYEHQGLDDRLEKFSQQVGIEQFPTVTATRSQGELVVVVDEGFVVQKQESSIAHTIATNSGPSVVKISLPYYPQQNPHFLSGIEVNTLQQKVRGDRVQALDVVARAALDDAMFGIKARAIARAIVKYNAGEKANDRWGGFGKFVAQVAAVISEVADTRSWRSLPHTVWVSRNFMPAGTHTVEVALLGRNGHALIKKRFKNVVIKPGQKTLISYRWATLPNNMVSR